MRYRVDIANRAPVETKETALVLAGLPPDRVFEASLVAIGADGEQSGVATATVLTYGLEVKHGFGTIDASGGGFCFAAGTAVARAAVAGGAGTDVTIVNSAGGASSLSFGSTAIAPGAQFVFGEFPPDRSMQFTQRVESDVDREGSDRFYVRTADGGFASVRVIARNFPNVAIEFVWRPAR